MRAQHHARTRRSYAHFALPTKPDESLLIPALSELVPAAIVSAPGCVEPGVDVGAGGV